VLRVPRTNFCEGSALALGWPAYRSPNNFPLLQLRVLGFGLLQDGDVGVGVFSELKTLFYISATPRSCPWI
jgi:hypothetical protein